MEILTFAPLIRVSTERQAKQGESLRTQRKQIENAIMSMGGKISRWYAGQEHATPAQERQILEQLIGNVPEKKFDAIIVADISRWSRDNGKSKQYLEIIKENKIRFFVLNREYDLFDPENAFILSLGVEIAEFFAREQLYKSVQNRIERAKRGIPTCGKLPYGRYFDKEKSQWIVNEDLKTKIEQAAADYLNNGGNFEKLGKKYGMNGSNLHKILTKRSGDKWEQRFQVKCLNIDETVLTTIPRLLPEDMISQIKMKCQAHKTYEHGVYKYRYLLSRIIFDKGSGHALTGTPNANGRRYYRTYKKCEQSYMINADELENVVTDAVFQALGCDELLNEAIFHASNNEQDNEMQKKVIELKNELKKIEKEIKKMADLISSFDEFSYPTFNAEFSQKMKDLEVKKSDIRFQIETLENKIRTIPNKSEISEMKKVWLDLTFQVQMSALHSGLLLSELPFLERQKIMSMLFGGKDENGKRYGIYISKKGKGNYSFEAYGKLGIIYGCSNGEGSGLYDNVKMRCVKESIMNPMADIMLKYNPWLGKGDNRNKQYMRTECHAYHSFRLHKR